MAFKCKIGLHSWDGCKCSDCDKTRDEQHDLSIDCEICSKCGKIKENQHDWSKDCDKCNKCGKSREEKHVWNKDCEKCFKCGKTRKNQHNWSNDCEKCSTCGIIRSKGHAWSGSNCTKCGQTRDADVYFIQGTEKLKLKEFKGAIKDYSTVIEINPNHTDAYINRGYAKNSIYDYESAIKDFNKAIEINPNEIGAYLNRGISKEGLQDYRGAITDYTKAIEINPNLADAYYNRGITKCNIKNFKGAIDDFTKLIELSPNDYQAYFNRGKAKSELKDYEGALADYDKVYKSDPKYQYDPVFGNKLSFVLKQLDGWEEKKDAKIKYTYKCDNCSKESNDSGGYAFYSDVPMMGNMLFCKACTDQIITEYSFDAPRKYSGSFDLFSLKGNQLNEINAEAIIARCKKFGFTPSQAKQKAKELGLEFHKDNKHGQDLIYEFWRSI